MKEKNLMTLSRKECLAVYKDILIKAKEKFDSAEILAKSKKFDSATALLIVGNEDLLKAFILYLDGIGFQFRSVKGMKSLFENHKLRYLLALILSFLIIFERDLKKALIFYVRFPFLLKRAHDKYGDSFGFDSQNFEARVERYFQNKLSQIKVEVTFFSKVEQTRQHGLYSDFQDGKVITIDELEYKTFYEKISSLNSTIYGLIDAFGSKDPTAKELVIDRLKKDFSNSYYKHLEKLLNTISHPSFNSYKILLQMIDDLNNEMRNKSK